MTMKNIRLLPAILCLALICFSCTQSDLKPKVTDGGTVNVTVGKNEVYIRDLGMLGIEDQASITKAPSHAKVNEVKRNNESHAIYSYQAVDGYIGADETVISICISNGSKCVSTQVTTLKINVTN
jgi:hypothetical protein